MRRSDSLPPFPPRYGSPRGTVPLLHSLPSLPGSRVLLPTGLGFAVPIAPFGVSAGTTGSPRFLGNPLCPCPALRPRWDLHARPLRRFGAAFRSLHNVGSHNQPAFGALSHGLDTRCLRFASGSPRPAQDSLPAAGQALPGRT